MWQRSLEIICLYISSKAAEGLWEKSGIFGYIDSLWLLAGLKTRRQAAAAKKMQLEELRFPGKGTHLLPSEACPLSTSVSAPNLSRSFLNRRRGWLCLASAAWDVCRWDERAGAWPGGTGRSQGNPPGWQISACLCAVIALAVISSASPRESSL